MNGGNTLLALLLISSTAACQARRSSGPHNYLYCVKDVEGDCRHKLQCFSQNRSGTRQTSSATLYVSISNSWANLVTGYTLLMQCALAHERGVFPIHTIGSGSEIV